MIHAQRFTAPNDFLAAAEPLLDADRARSTIVSTVATGLLSAPDPSIVPTLVVCAAGDRVLGLALRTPPYPLTVLIDPAVEDRAAAAAALATAVREAEPLPEMLTGPRVDVQAVGEALAAGDTKTRPYTAMLLYRLGTLTEPSGVSGASRTLDVDDPADLDLAARWSFDFAQETGSVPMPSAPEPEVIRRRADRGGQLAIWVDGGRPVALAGHSAVVARMARIGPVYTPEWLRGNGYGSAATAAAVRSAQRRGATTVVLFTDADYPPSNAVYRRLGFQPVEEFLELELLPRT